MQQIHSQTGMTLLELVLGIFLTTLLASAIVPLLAISLHSWQSDMSRVQLKQSARMAVEVMAHEIRYAQAITDPPANGRNLAMLSLVNEAGTSAAFRLGTSQGANPHTLYRSIRLTDNPITEDTVTHLSFDVIRLGNAHPALITISITMADPATGETQTLRTAVAALNIHE